MVAIITLNFNQNDYTIKCVESVLSSSYQDIKLILIDNGSSASNFLSLKKLLPKNSTIKLHQIDKNIGYVGGINFGLEKAALLNPEFILIMNNDTIMDVNAVRELVKTCIKYEKKVIVTGKVYHYDQPDVFQDIGYSFSNRKALKVNRIGLNEKDVGQYDQISERDLLDDVFWLFDLDLYKKIGGYSPYFWFSAEQADFALRANNIGYKLIFTPEAKIWHKGSVSIGGRERNPKLAYWHMQSTLIFRFRHLSIIEFIKQYFKKVKSILSSYYQSIKAKLLGKPITFEYPNAKLSGLLYFHKWFFLRNKNKGKNPFQ